MSQNSVPRLDVPEFRLRGEVFDLDTPAQLVSSNPGQSDYPGLCLDGTGGAWCTWVTYAEGTDELYVAHWESDGWSEPVQVPNVGTDLYKPTCVVDGNGDLLVVWSQQVDGDWGLWYSVLVDGAWFEPGKAVEWKGPNLGPRLARCPDGTVVMAWQAWCEDHFGILCARYCDGEWGLVETVSSGRGNDWLPDIAAGPDGTVSIVWDSYRHGSYDVFLRQWRDGVWADEVLIAGSPNFEANVSIAADHAGRVWIAYEERKRDWGKDKSYFSSFRESEVDSLAAYSRVRVRCYTSAGVMRPAQPCEQPVTFREWGGDVLPQIATGADGRVWLLFRRPQVKWMALSTFSRLIPAGTWYNYARFFDGNAWSQEISLQDEPSRVDSDLRGTVLDDGRLLAVWHTEHRVPSARDTFWVPRLPSDNRLYSNLVPSPGRFGGDMRLCGMLAGISHAHRAGAEQERKDVETARAHSIVHDGQTLKLYRGDLHRHTAISQDGPSDGSLTDLFRYALDAAALDFVAVTDHNNNGGTDIEYVWWQTQKTTDLYYVPHHFVTFFGYEWAAGVEGHRNVIEPRRGNRPFPNPRDRGEPERASHVLDLFEHVRRVGGITIPHSTSYHGRNAWEIDDPDMQPVVEIYQGCRGSAESADGPLSGPYVGNLTDDSNRWPQGYVWEAWKKGRRIGVICSSDHQATHTSFANVYAKEGTRQGLLDAIRQRHTYGSTDTIVLSFSGAGRMQGDEETADGQVSFQVNVLGTDAIRELVLFRNYKEALRASSGERRLSVHWHDATPEDETIYFVRIVQEDGQVAWSSPIWLKGIKEKKDEL